MAKLNILKLKNAKSQGETFKKEHPELIAFGAEVWSEAFKAGTKFTLRAETPDGKSRDAAFSLTQFDVDFIKGLFKEK